jgi:hypothetical protein
VANEATNERQEEERRGKEVEGEKEKENSMPPESQETPGAQETPAKDAGSTEPAFGLLDSRGKRQREEEGPFNPRLNPGRSRGLEKRGENVFPIYSARDRAARAMRSLPEIETLPSELRKVIKAISTIVIAAMLEDPPKVQTQKRTTEMFAGEAVTDTPTQADPTPADTPTVQTKKSTKKKKKSWAKVASTPAPTPAGRGKVGQVTMAKPSTIPRLPDGDIRSSLASMTPNRAWEVLEARKRHQRGVQRRNKDLQSMKLVYFTPNIQEPYSVMRFMMGREGVRMDEVGWLSYLGGKLEVAVTDTYTTELVSRMGKRWRHHPGYDPTPRNAQEKERYKHRMNLTLKGLAGSPLQGQVRKHMSLVLTDKTRHVHLTPRKEGEPQQDPASTSAMAGPPPRAPQSARTDTQESTSRNASTAPVGSLADSRWAPEAARAGGPWDEEGGTVGDLPPFPFTTPSPAQTTPTQARTTREPADTMIPDMPTVEDMEVPEGTDHTQTQDTEMVTDVIIEPEPDIQEDPPSSVGTPSQC